LKKTAGNEYYSKCDNESFYVYARSKSKSKVQVGSLNDFHVRQINDDKDIVTHLNKYFSSVFTEESNVSKCGKINPQFI